MATHSSTLAWKIPWTDGGAWQAAVHGVAKSRTQLSDFTFTFMHWRRKWQPNPVFLPGESQGQRSLVVCRLWGRTESDTTEATQQQQQGFHLQKQWPLLMGSMQSFVHLYCSVEWGGSCTSKKKKKNYSLSTLVSSLTISNTLSSHPTHSRDPVSNLSGKRRLSFSLLNCIQIFLTPWTTALQVPLSMGFPRQEYWSKLSFKPNIQKQLHLEKYPGFLSLFCP